MAAPEALGFRDENGKKHEVPKKNIVAVIKRPEEPRSTILYTEASSQDDASPPIVRITTCEAGAGVQPPDTSDTETHVVISTGSGTNKAGDFYESAVKPALQAIYPKGFDNFLLHYTESAASVLVLTEDILVATANAGTSLRIILLSGDGGVVDLVNGLAAKPLSSDYLPPQVVLIPLGTANALYHSINAGKDDTWGLSTLVLSNARPLPLFKASFSPGARLLADEARREEELPKDPQSSLPSLHGAVVCSWGMHASLVADSDTSEYRKFGVDRFKMAAKEALYPADGSPPHPYKGKVSIRRSSQWEPLPEDEHMYVLATLVSNLEKPFCISPASKPLDGTLHLVRFGPTTGDEAMRIMGLAYQGGKHVDDDKVLYEKIDGLRIDFASEFGEDGRWRRVCVDGKIVRVEQGGWMEILTEAKRVLDVVVR